MILSVDFSKINKIKKVKKKIKLKIIKDGIINGVRISGKTIFGDGTLFSHSPAYSFPIILPINGIKVNNNDEFFINIEYSICNKMKGIVYSIKKNKIKIWNII